jgi:hypothetical protein
MRKWYVYTYVLLFFIETGIKHKYDIMDCLLLTTKGVNKNKDASTVKGDETNISKHSASTLSKKTKVCPSRYETTQEIIM